MNVELHANLVHMMKTTKGTRDGRNSTGDNIMDNFNNVKFRGTTTSQLVE